MSIVAKWSPISATAEHLVQTVAQKLLRTIGETDLYTIFLYKTEQQLRPPALLGVFPNGCIPM